LSAKLIKLLVVDDHQLVRKGIVSLLKDVKEIKIIGEASSGEDAIELAREKQPHVVLMDLQMPGIGGLEATRKLLHLEPQIKVVIVTVCDSEIFPTRLLEEGAAGYITKGSDKAEMLKAIKAVMGGERYIGPDIAQKLALNRVTGSKSAMPFDSLSERELQVMLMITAGEKPQLIAEKLNLSPKTVNTYRYRIFEKLNVKSDVELTHLAIRYGIIDNQGFFGAK
jgi:two-component system, NarL family, invasion response regulator UvrY